MGVHTHTRELTTNAVCIVLQFSSPISSPFIDYIHSQHIICDWCSFSFGLVLMHRRVCTDWYDEGCMHQLHCCMVDWLLRAVKSENGILRKYKKPTQAPACMHHCMVDLVYAELFGDRRMFKKPGRPAWMHGKTRVRRRLCIPYTALKLTQDTSFVKPTSTRPACIEVLHHGMMDGRYGISEASITASM